MYYPELDVAIAAYLRREGMTQAQLAEKLGMSENTLSWKRRGVNGKEFSVSEAVKIAHICGVSLDETVMA